MVDDPGFRHVERDERELEEEPENDQELQCQTDVAFKIRHGYYELRGVADKETVKIGHHNIIAKNYACSEKEASHKYQGINIPLLFFIKTRRDEHPYLVYDDRGRDGNGGDDPDLEIGKEGLRHCGEYKTAPRGHDLPERLEKEHVHPFLEKICQGEGKANGQDAYEEPLPQFLEM